MWPSLHLLLHTLGNILGMAILLNSVWKTVNAFCIISASRCTNIRFSVPGITPWLAFSIAP